jgi:type VI protein secretion system component VasK
MLAFSIVSSLRLQLPAGDVNTSMLNIVTCVRDSLDGVTEFTMQSVTVVPDAVVIANLVNDVQQSSIRAVSNPIIELLASGNQNAIAQVITSLSQVFNKMSSEMTNSAVASKYPFIY